MSQNRRSPSHYPPGSFWVGGQICIPHHCANKSLSETAGTLPGSAILCPVSRQCLKPCQQHWLWSWGGVKPLGLRRRLSSEEVFQSVPEKNKHTTTKTDGTCSYKWSASGQWIRFVLVDTKVEVMDWQILCDRIMGLHCCWRVCQSNS